MDEWNGEPDLAAPNGAGVWDSGVVSDMVRDEKRRFWPTEIKKKPPEHGRAFIQSASQSGR